MTLLDRLLGLEELKFAVHDFYAANRLYAQGDATRVQIKGALNGSADPSHHLTAAEQNQWDGWADNIDLEPTLNDKVNYVDQIHSYLILGEVGLASKAQVKTWLNVPD